MLKTDPPHPHSPLHPLPPKPFWQAEIADTYTPRVECDRALSGRSCGKEGAPWSSSAKSAPLSSYYLWKLNNLPCKQNDTANVYSAVSAPQRRRKKKQKLGASVVPRHDKNQIGQIIRISSCLDTGASTARLKAKVLNDQKWKRILKENGRLTSVWNEKINEDAPGSIMPFYVSVITSWTHQYRIWPKALTKHSPILIHPRLK